MPKANVKKEELPKESNVKKLTTPTKKTTYTDTKRIVNEETGELKQTVTNTIAIVPQ